MLVRDADDARAAPDLGDADSIAQFLHRAVEGGEGELEAVARLAAQIVEKKGEPVGACEHAASPLGDRCAVGIAHQVGLGAGQLDAVLGFVRGGGEVDEAEGEPGASAVDDPVEAKLPDGVLDVGARLDDLDLGLDRIVAGEPQVAQEISGAPHLFAAHLQSRRRLIDGRGEEGIEPDAQDDDEKSDCDDAAATVQNAQVVGEVDLVFRSVVRMVLRGIVSFHGIPDQVYGLRSSPLLF